MRKCEVPEINWSAVADRFEKLFDVLTSDTMGAKTICVDYGAANRAIAHCRSLAAGEKEYPAEFMSDEEAEMIEFLLRHNQSWAWVFEGDPASMILELALNSSSVKRPELRVV